MTTKEGILKLDYYVLPENYQKAREHFMQAKDVIRIFTGYFGAYPWMKDGYKLVEGPFGGMEHQTAIAYGSAYKNLPALGGDDMIVHETAHEWWGNAVSVSDFSDIWLQEGFATYSEILFAEKIKGYESSLLYARYYLASMINNKLPVVGPPDVSYWDNSDNDVYNKGAMVLHTMRNIINDSLLFFDILQTFYREHAVKSHVTTADFIELVERKTGKDWSTFFKVYLYQREVPVLLISYCTYNADRVPIITDPGSATFIAAKWKNVPEDFIMPVEMNYNDGDAPVILEVSTKAALFKLEERTSGKQWICNKRLSYFQTITDKSLLKEITLSPEP
jgi:aminopeptidase N